MKNNKSIFIFFIFTILHLNFAYSQDFEKKPTWEENFKKLRSNTWNNGANVNGGQCYTNFDPQTTYVKKGKLHLKAKEATKIPAYIDNRKGALEKDVIPSIA